MNIPGYFLLSILWLCTLTACKKWTDSDSPDDPRLNERKYCNDPTAVNYNWNFPGQPDSSVCIYPSDLYTGTYSYTDSVYDSQNIFDSTRSTNNYLFTIFATGKTSLRITGFCGPSASLPFTAQRSSYRAAADTTIFMDDTVKVYGQLFCRTQDTLTGYFIKNQYDSTVLLIDFRVVSDTGINFHRGTAIKQ